MARKFLYIVAFLIVMVIAGMAALRFFAADLSRAAFVPREEFVPQTKAAANAYDDPAMWIARPGLPDDPSRWLPPGLEEDAGALNVPVFFVHPTSYLRKANWNAPLDDTESRERAALMVRAMASPFNRSDSIWAPRYRQATFGAFLTDRPEGRMALDAAYADVLQAFDHFIDRIGLDTPFVLAGHSQGAYMIMRLMQDRVAGTPLARRTVAAYVIGWPVSLRHDLPEMGLPACQDTDQAGCVVSWGSFADPAEPDLPEPGMAAHAALDGAARLDAPPLCTNPLTGTPGGAAPASANLGTLVPDADLRSAKLVPGLVPARCDARGLLLIGDPPAMGPYVLPGNNYHVYDIPLFWTNLRGDFVRRVGAWKP